MSNAFDVRAVLIDTGPLISKMGERRPIKKIKRCQRLRPRLNTKNLLRYFGHHFHNFTDEQNLASIFDVPLFIIAT